MMDQQMSKLLACAAQTAAVTFELTEAVREGGISIVDNVGSGETLTLLADGMRLLIEATEDAEANQLHGALLRFLEDRE